MNSDDKYKYLLTDIISEIIELKIDNVSEKSTEFDKGHNFAIYNVVSLVIQQCEVFDISLDEIGLTNINPEKDFLSL